MDPSYDSDDQNAYSDVLASPISLKHKAGTITCSGYNFELNGYSFCDDTTKYLPLLEPIRGKNNRILKDQPRVEKQPMKWWKAQCGFRDLDTKGPGVEPLQARLRAAPRAPMTTELREIQGRLKQDFWKKNNKACEDHNKSVIAVRDAQWPTMTDEQKIAADDRRFLKEAFPDGELSDPITVKLRYVGLLLNTTRHVGVRYNYYQYPMGHKGREGKYDFIIALGPETSNKEALAKWEKVSGQITRLSEQEKKQADLATHKKAQRVVEASGNRTNWIVTGTYKIKCPVIEKDYGEDDRSITIFAEKGQLFAKFNMGIIEGYMRLERHAKDIPTSGGGADTGTTAKKRKRAEFEDEDIPYDPYDSDRRSPTPEEFHLGKVTMPSPEYPSWDYRWRGTDTGCGEHQIDSEKKFYKMTFLEPLGMTIEGTFGSEYHKDCSFMAHKIATGKPYDGNISEAWAELSEDAISYR